MSTILKDARKMLATAQLSPSSISGEAFEASCASISGTQVRIRVFIDFYDNGCECDFVVFVFALVIFRGYIYLQKTRKSGGTTLCGILVRNTVVCTVSRYTSQ